MRNLNPLEFLFIDFEGVHSKKKIRFSVHLRGTNVENFSYKPIHKRQFESTRDIKFALLMIWIKSTQSDFLSAIDLFIYFSVHISVWNANKNKELKKRTKTCRRQKIPKRAGILHAYGNINLALNIRHETPTFCKETSLLSLFVSTPARRGQRGQKAAPGPDKEKKRTLRQKNSLLFYIRRTPSSLD